MDTTVHNSSDILFRCPSNTTNHVYLAGGLSLLVMYIIIISLNSLILFVIFGVKHRTLRWSLDYLVSFLAITDMISTAVALPIPIIAYLQGYWPGSCNLDTDDRLSTFNLTCKQFYMFVTWGRLSTMFIITMMCTERFLAIIKPFVHRDVVTAGRLRKCVYGIWLGAFIYCFLPVIGFGSVDLHYNMHIDDPNITSTGSPYFFCFIDYEHVGSGAGKELKNMIYAIIFVLFGLITLTIVLFCVCFICRMLLVRRPNLTKSIKSNSRRSPCEKKANGSTTGEKPKSLSIIGRSLTFIQKKKQIKNKYEPEELQFIILMLIIAALFYITFLPTMVLVFCNILHVELSDQYTFWAMRLTSFVTISNPLVYGISNKLYRVGCCWVFKSIWAALSCKKIPIPERLGPRKMSINSLAQQHYAHSQLSQAERNAQAFIIAASQNKEVALAKTFIGKMKISAEGERFDEMFQLEPLDENDVGLEFEGPESYVARNELCEECNDHGNVNSCRHSNVVNKHLLSSSTNIGSEYTNVESD